ncbi:MAG: hypothetical protein AAGF49_10195, partial [Pseudomonadota bacterium]
MNAVGLNSAALSAPAAAMTSPAGMASPSCLAVGSGAMAPTGMPVATGMKGLCAANDSAPKAQSAPAVTLPAHLTVRRLRERSVDVSISREAVTFSPPDAAAATQPLASYRGISASVAGSDGEPLFRITLEHEDPAQCVPLTSGIDVAAVARERQREGFCPGLP